MQSITLELYVEPAFQLRPDCHPSENLAQHYRRHPLEARQAVNLIGTSVLFIEDVLHFDGFADLLRDRTGRAEKVLDKGLPSSHPTFAPGIPSKEIVLGRPRIKLVEHLDVRGGTPPPGGRFRYSVCRERVRERYSIAQFLQRAAFGLLLTSEVYAVRLALPSKRRSEEPPRIGRPETRIRLLKSSRLEIHWDEIAVGLESWEL